MTRFFYAAAIAALLLTACVVVPTRHGPEIVPALPAAVELGADPYYYQSGYYYFYNNHRWSYSRSKRGPWRDLPRDHYPRKTHYRHRWENRD